MPQQPAEPVKPQDSTLSRIIHHHWGAENTEGCHRGRYPEVGPLPEQLALRRPRSRPGRCVIRFCLFWVSSVFCVVNLPGYSELNQADRRADRRVVADLVAPDLEGQVEIGESAGNAETHGAEFVPTEVPLR